MTQQNTVMVGSSLGNRFWVKDELDTSDHWKIYKARDVVVHQDVAIKVAHPKGPLSSRIYHNSYLEKEYQTLMQLDEYWGFPKVFELDTHGDGDCYLAMQLMERPLIKMKQRNNQISMLDMLLVVDQLLARLEILHGLGMVHGDIRPESLMMGRDNVKGVKGTVYLTDFGLATNYRSNLISNQGETSLCYMSIRGHDGHPKMPRDDLESLAYVLAYFLRHKNLPWKAEEDARLVKAKKMKVTGKELFPELPQAFATFYDEVRSLKCDEQPDHKKYKKMFRKYGRKLVIAYDHDWPLYSF